MGHGPVRTSVMGVAERAASPADLRQMERLVEESMAEGAFGFSSGLEYTPGKNADPSELTTLTSVVARYGGIYTTHIRNRDYHYQAAIEEAISTAEQAQVPLQISHIAPRWGSPPGSGPWALERVDQAYQA